MSSPSPRAFEEIPGIGPRLAKDLWDLGFCGVEELEGEDPEALFARLRSARSEPTDPRIRYVLRSAVYFASHRTHDPELLRWWNWQF